MAAVKAGRRKSSGYKPIKIKHPGLFTKKAKAAGMSVQAYARKERNAPGKLGKEARFALAAKKFKH